MVDLEFIKFLKEKTETECNNCSNDENCHRQQMEQLIRSVSIPATIMMHTIKDDVPELAEEIMISSMMSQLFSYAKDNDHVLSIISKLKEITVNVDKEYSKH